MTSILTSDAGSQDICFYGNYRRKQVLWPLFTSHNKDYTK